MKPELQDKLLRRFPGMYKGYYKSMDQTCMCWGFDCSDGWYEILYMLSLAIEDELNYSWLQKKKFMLKGLLGTKWRNFIYRLSPPGTDDPIGKLFKTLRPKSIEDNFGDKGFYTHRWYFLGKSWASLECGLKMLICWPYTGFEVTQVKEKYGSLRFYTNGSNDRIDALIAIADRASTMTCEECGKRGKITNDTGWYVCRCQECRKARNDSYGVETPESDDDE